METEAISKAESGLTYGKKIAVYLLGMQTLVSWLSSFDGESAVKVR